MLLFASSTVASGNIDTAFGFEDVVQLTLMLHEPTRQVWPAGTVALSWIDHTLPPVIVGLATKNLTFTCELAAAVTRNIIKRDKIIFFIVAEFSLFLKFLNWLSFLC